MTGPGGVLPALLAGAAVVVVGLLPSPAHLRLRHVARVRVTSPGAPVDPVAAVRDMGTRLVVALAAAVGSVGLVVGGPVLAVLGVALVALTRRTMRARWRATAATRERARAVEACSALAAELRVGRVPYEALAVAADVASGPSQEALRAAAAAARIGGDVSGALLGGVPAGSAVPEVLRGLAACWAACSRVGSGLADAVEQLAEGLRSRQEQDLAVDAALAGPQATAGLLAVLPLGGMGLAAGLGAHPVHVLLHTPVGAGCLLVGCSLDALGVWWTGRLVARARSAR